MSNLLSAEFTRLWKSFIFRLGLLVSAGLGVILVLTRWWDVKMHADIYAEYGIECSNADGLLFSGGMYLIFAVAVVVGIFVGTEYSDGTIRNKLTAGHTRGKIYLSKLIVCAVASVMMHVLYILVVLLLGNLLIGGTTLKMTEILGFTAVSTMAMIAMTALLLTFSMSIQSKAAGSVVCLLTTMLLLFATMTVFQKLEAPEYYEGYFYTDEETGELVEVEREKNLSYLTGTKRKVYKFLNDFLPVSQLYQVCMNETPHQGMLVCYDCMLVLVTTGAGMLIFQKKNLK